MESTKGVLTLGALVSSLFFYNALMPTNDTQPEILSPPPAMLHEEDDFLGGFATVQTTNTPVYYTSTSNPSSTNAPTMIRQKVPEEFVARTLFIFDKLMNDPKFSNWRMGIEIFSFLVTILVFLIARACFKRRPKEELPTDYNELIRRIEEQKEKLKKMEKRKSIVEDLERQKEKVEQRRTDLANIREENEGLRARLQSISQSQTFANSPAQTPQKEVQLDDLDEDFNDDDPETVPIRSGALKGVVIDDDEDNM